jgi:hypothetical protein
MTEQLVPKNGDTATLERGASITTEADQAVTGDNLTITDCYSTAEKKYFIVPDAGDVLRYEKQIDFSLHSSATQLTEALHQLSPDIAKDVLKIYDLFKKA